MTTIDSPRAGVRTREGAELGERENGEDAMRAPTEELGEREQRVARRRAVVEQEQQERELEARVNAWQRERESRGDGEAREEGETERHATATEVDHRRGAQRYSSEDENVYSLPTRREVALRAFEEAEDARRIAQRDEEPVDLLDWAASTLMRTPSSAPPRTLFAQRQLSPIPSEEDFT